MDIKTPEERSKNMSAIRCRNTKPEIILRKELFKRGLRYRVNYNLKGKPDIVFPGKSLVIFVDGCFWHGCPACYKEPETNTEFWRNKIKSNKERDKKVNQILENQGWRVERFWEHEVYKDVLLIAQKVKKIVTNTN